MESDNVPNVLADRYASPAMKAVWSTRGRVVLEREYWIAVMKAQRDLGLDIPAEALTAYEKVKDKVDCPEDRRYDGLDGGGCRNGEYRNDDGRDWRGGSGWCNCD